MNSSINRNPDKIIYIPNCSDNTYRALKELALVKNESLNQICCDILFDFKGTPYIFEDSSELLKLKHLINHIFNSLDYIADIEYKEAHILTLAYKESSNKAFLTTRNKIQQDNQQIISKTVNQYIVISHLWHMFNTRHESVTNFHNVKKHLLKVSKNLPLHQIHPKKPLHAIHISVPERLYLLLKYVCNARKISFHVLFSATLLHNNLLPNIIPTLSLLNKLPKTKSPYQRNLVNNYVFYQAIKKSLHKIDNEDYKLYIQYNSQYKTFLKIIKNILSN